MRNQIISTTAYSIILWMNYSINILSVPFTLLYQLIVSDLVLKYKAKPYKINFFIFLGSLPIILFIIR
jgi:hypothetical protein